MKNCLIIDRARYENIMSKKTLSDVTSTFSYNLIQMIDFFIIENEDGSAQFLKNRRADVKFMTKEEYQKFSSEETDC